MKTKKIKNLKQKIIIPIIVLLLFNFAMPNYSQANFGGKLMEPIVEFFAALGDIINDLIARTSGAGDTYLKETETVERDPYNGIKIALQDSGALQNGDHSAEAIRNYFLGNGSQGTQKIVEKVIKIGKEDEVGECDGYIEKKKDLLIPSIKITPIEIFAGKVALLDANFFRSIDSEYKETMIGAGDPKDSTDNGLSAAANLKKTISSWYQALRLIAIVGLLSVLVYVAIRIVISATATDKAKYKERLMDWVIALCLVFFLHYIMVFTMTMVGEIQKLFVNNGSSSKNINNILVNIQDKDGNTQTYSASSQNDPAADAFSASPGVSSIGDLPAIFPTNLTGYNRILIENENLWEKLTYLIMYLALTFYTLYFFFIYIKRVVILTFLTIIAPLVALTYPIDKIKDSKAQAFEFWLREYIVNAMLPVIHLILYTVLVSSALDLVTKSPLYAICVLAFIVPAEKMVKSMFGIKSETAPTLGGFAGGALAAQMLQNLAKGKGKEKSKGGSDKIRTKDNGNVTDPNVVEGDGLDALAEGGTAAQTNAGEEQQLPEQTVMEGFEDENQQGQSGQTGVPETNSQDAEDATVPAMPEGTENDEESEDNNSKNSYRKNFENMIRRKYDLPQGKKGKLIVRGFKTVGKAGKLYLRGAAITGGAAIGLAGGIVGGDLNDMWKGASLGAIAGNSIGDSVGRGAENKITNTVRSLSSMADEIRYGSKEAQNRAADKEFMNNVDNRQHIADAIKKENPEIKRKELNAELEKRMEEYAKYRRTGVTDIKEMDKLHSISSQIQSGGASEETARKQTLEIAKLSTHYNAETFRDAGKSEKATQALAQRFEKKGLSKAQAAAAANNAMNHVRSIKGE